jgi:microcystin-dependent protein
MSSFARNLADLAQAFVPGTKMLFQQTAAPTGWTKDTAHDNKALRVVSGTAGSGGSVAFTTAFASGLSAGNTTLTTAQMPSHTHPTRYGFGTFNWVFQDAQVSGNPNRIDGDSGSAGSSNAHNHTLPSFAVQYVDLIIATKA